MNARSCCLNFNHFLNLYHSRLPKSSLFKAFISIIWIWLFYIVLILNISGKLLNCSFYKIKMLLLVINHSWWTYMSSTYCFVLSLCQWCILQVPNFYRRGFLHYWLMATPCGSLNLHIRKGRGSRVPGGWGIWERGSMLDEWTIITLLSASFWEKWSNYFFFQEAQRITTISHRMAMSASFAFSPDWCPLLQNGQIKTSGFS